MFARSTACRHGLGRTSANAVSMTHQLPSRTSRFAGLMSRWARPISHIRRTTDSPWSMIDVVDLGLADLAGAVEELGDQQVLALGGDLHDAERMRHRQPGVGQQAQDVVLVLHQPAHAVEGLLVLQPAVEQGAAELVPAVGRARAWPRTACRTRSVSRSRLHGDPQRRRAARPVEAERLHRRWRAGRAGPAAPGRSPRRGRPSTSRWAVRPRR